MTPAVRRALADGIQSIEAANADAWLVCTVSLPRQPYLLGAMTGSGANSKLWFTTSFLLEEGAGERWSECGSGVRKMRVTAGR